MATTLRSASDRPPGAPAGDRRKEIDMKMAARWTILVPALMACIVLLPQAKAGDEAIALKGATIHTAVGPPITGGIIVMESGRIAAVGTNVSIPGGARVIDVSGKTIIPGMIDPHTHIGAFDADDVNEMPQPLGPENRAIDGIHLGVPDWQEAVEGGVTAVITGPGSGERMGGQSITLKTYGNDLKKRVLREGGDLKMAVNARNLSHITDIYANFLKAREYLARHQKYEAGDKKGPPPKRDLALEALAAALKREVPVRVHIYLVPDMLSFLEMKREFGFDLQFIHSVESYKIADQLAAQNVACICLPLGTRYHETPDQLRGIAALHKAGVKVALHTDHPVIHEKWHRLNAAMAIRYGLPEDAALKAMTINPAEMAGVAGRIGSIEVGKDADLVVLNGPWFEPRSRVEMVFVDGTLAFDRVRQEKPAQEDRR
jgi:imidazolonepropionase-like amidohydrolase